MKTEKELKAMKKEDLLKLVLELQSEQKAILGDSPGIFTEKSWNGTHRFIGVESPVTYDLHEALKAHYDFYSLNEFTEKEECFLRYVGDVRGVPAGIEWAILKVYCGKDETVLCRVWAAKEV